jgi:hypothetical protein
VIQALPPVTVTPGGHTCGNTWSPPGVPDCVIEFKKGIKRDPPSFAVLEDKKHWDSLHQQTLKAQTCYQDVNNVLNLSYMPNAAEDIALSDEKQKYT